MGGGDLGECSVSTSTSLRHRGATLRDSESRIKKDFQTNMPKFIIMHWDGKVIKYAKKRETDERLAIVGSFPRPDNLTILPTAAYCRIINCNEIHYLVL